MRRMAVVLFSLFLLLQLSAATAFCADDNEGIMPMAENYDTARAIISLLNNTATVTGTIIGIAGQTTKTSVHLYLQRYVNGSWVNVDDWLSSGYTASRSLTKTKTVTKGYKYRSKAVCEAYNGSNKETVTKYSSLVTC